MIRNFFAFKKFLQLLHLLVVSEAMKATICDFRLIQYFKGQSNFESMANVLIAVFKLPVVIVLWGNFLM